MDNLVNALVGVGIVIFALAKMHVTPGPLQILRCTSRRWRLASQFITRSCFSLVTTLVLDRAGAGADVTGTTTSSISRGTRTRFLAGGCSGSCLAGSSRSSWWPISRPACWGASSTRRSRCWRTLAGAALFAVGAEPGVLALRAEAVLEREFLTPPGSHRKQQNPTRLAGPLAFKDLRAQCAVFRRFEKNRVFPLARGQSQPLSFALTFFRGIPYSEMLLLPPPINFHAEIQNR